MLTLHRDAPAEAQRGAQRGEVVCTELHSGSGAVPSWGGGGVSSSFVTPSPGPGNYSPCRHRPRLLNSLV